MYVCRYVLVVDNKVKLVLAHPLRKRALGTPKLGNRLRSAWLARRCLRSAALALLALRSRSRGRWATNQLGAAALSRVLGLTS